MPRIAYKRTAYRNRVQPCADLVSVGEGGQGALVQTWAGKPVHPSVAGPLLEFRGNGFALSPGVIGLVSATAAYCLARYGPAPDVLRRQFDFDLTQHRRRRAVSLHALPINSNRLARAICQFV